MGYCYKGRCSASVTGRNIKNTLLEHAINKTLVQIAKEKEELKQKFIEEKLQILSKWNWCFWCNDPKTEAEMMEIINRLDNGNRPYTDFEFEYYRKVGLYGHDTTEWLNNLKVLISCAGEDHTFIDVRDVYKFNGNLNDRCE
jgi:phosphopantothenoylcysteine synthetase/decarboxylase